MPEQENTMGLIKPRGLPPLMVVSFGLVPDRQVEFNDFYHNQFLPELFALSPQLRSIKRFEKFDIGSPASTDDREFFTFYELDSEDTLDKTDAIFGHSQFAKTLAAFRQYKETALTNFSRVSYQPIHRSERVSEGAGLAATSFSCCYLTYFELSAGKEEKFFEWYLGQYQPEVFSQTLDLCACHSYKIYEAGPTRLLTVYEAVNEQAMKRSLEQLGKAHFAKENTTWQAYCRDYTVLRLSAFAVRSIFALP